MIRLQILLKITSVFYIQVLMRDFHCTDDLVSQVEEAVCICTQLSWIADAYLYIYLDVSVNKLLRRKLGRRPVSTTSRRGGDSEVGWRRRAMTSTSVTSLRRGRNIRQISEESVMSVEMTMVWNLYRVGQYKRSNFETRPSKNYTSVLIHILTICLSLTLEHSVQRWTKLDE